MGEVNAFLQAHHRLPTRWEPNGEWLVDMWKAHRQHQVDGEFAEFVLQHGEHFQTKVRTWNDTFYKVIRFMEQAKRFPRQNAKDETEAANAKWLEKQFQNYKKKTGVMSHEPVCKQFSDFIQTSHNYSTSQVEDKLGEWMRMLAGVHEFIVINKRRPHNVSRDVAEQKLAKWFLLQLRNFRTGKMEADQLDAMQNFLDTHQNVVRVLKHEWSKRLDQVRLFIQKHKRRPSSSSEDVVEKKLGQWLYYQHHVNLKNRTGFLRDEKVRRIFEEFIDKNNAYFRRLRMKKTSPQYVNHIRGRLCKIQSFLDENHHRPRVSSKDKDEKQMASWLRYYLRFHKNKEDDVPDHVKVLLADFFQKNDHYLSIGRYAVWKKKLEELRDFFKKNRRLPSEEDGGKEKVLRVWLKDQQQAFRRKERIMMDEKARCEFDALIKEFTGLFTETTWKKWIDRLEELDLFCKEYHHRPSSKSTNAMEKKLGMWATRQLSMHRHQSGIMRTKDVYDRFQQFLTTHPEIF